VISRTVDNGWVEATVTWNTAPAAVATVGTIGPVAVGNW
jgi:hypothetical protein